jgi:hypothetical protein
MTRVFRDSFENPFTALKRLCSYTAIPILLLAFACAFVGCDSDEGGDDDNSTKAGKNGGQAGAEEELEPDAGDETDTDAADEPAEEGISLSWNVKAIGESISDWMEQPGLEGVEVCLIESVDLPCVYTDETGVFELQGVPKNSELLLTFTKEGYLPQLVTVKTGTESLVSLITTQPLMVEKNRIDEELDALGVVLDESKGHIKFAAVYTSLTTGVSGRVSVSIDPPAGERPSFFDTDIQAVPDATAFSEGVIVALFGNLEEGEYVISWEVEEPENIYCESLAAAYGLFMRGLPTEQPNTVLVTVRAGFVSGDIVISCAAVTDPAADAG